MLASASAALFGSKGEIKVEYDKRGRQRNEFINLGKRFLALLQLLIIRFGRKPYEFFLEKSIDRGCLRMGY